MENLCEAKGASFMPPTPEYQVLDHQLPVMINKTQMNGEHGASQCGLTSLLPMSCRGRAAAFARDLHSRLRTLGQAQDDDETGWLDPQQRPSTNGQRDLETFYDFELECESPSSPVDEYDPPFADPEPEPPFLDAEVENRTEKPKNGFRFSTSFYTQQPPVKLQPAARENGHKDKPLYTAITFEGCARQNSRDEIDCGSVSVIDRLGLPQYIATNLDSDSEFESAKSEPSDAELSQSEKAEEAIDLTESVENVSVTEAEAIQDSITEVEAIQDEDTLSNTTIGVEAIECNSKVIETISTEPITKAAVTEITSEVPNDKEVSPATEIEPLLLKVDEVSEEHDDDDRPLRVRRCSSLKTGKTPPGTPGRKKIVRFADVLGLDLADVKTFMDEIPVIPKSAYDDLTGCDVACSPPTARPPQRFGTLTLVPLFQLPRDVTDILQTRNVCLESARVCDGVHVTVCGSVRVRNLDFHKTVHIRYTMNRWKTFTDLQTTYVQGSCDGFSDKFQFLLYVPCITSGQRLEMAVRFQCKGQQLWDNNCGANYCFDCLALGTAAAMVAPYSATSSPLHPTVDWHPSFY